MTVVQAACFPHLHNLDRVIDPKRCPHARQNVSPFPPLSDMRGDGDVCTSARLRESDGVWLVGQTLVPPRRCL